MQRARPLSALLATGAHLLVAFLFVWLAVSASFANARHATLSGDPHCVPAVNHEQGGEQDGGAPVRSPADHLQGCCAFSCAGCCFPPPLTQISKTRILREAATGVLLSACSPVAPKAPERSPASPRAPPGV